MACRRPPSRGACPDASDCAAGCSVGPDAIGTELRATEPRAALPPRPVSSPVEELGLLPPEAAAGRDEDREWDEAAWLAMRAWEAISRGRGKDKS